jgi:stage II sporulation protein P
MKRDKYRVVRLFHMGLWSGIFLFSLYILIKCMQVFAIGTSDQSAKVLETQVVLTACNYMIESNVPILNYISDQEENETNNAIITNLAGVFPINRYIAEVKEVDNTIIEEEQGSIKLANGSDLLYNKDIYLALVIKDKEGNQTNEEGNNTGSNTNTYSNSEGYNIDMNTIVNGIMPIDIISGEVYLETEDTDDTYDDATDSQETLGTINGEHFTLEQLLNRQFLYNNFYIVASTTTVSDDLFDAEVLLGKDMTMDLDADKPQILIYHTHSQEAYSDSRENEEEDTVVGLGTKLAEVLTDKYGIQVLHDKTKYDLMGGTLDRNLAYNYANVGISKILEDNPSIEVVIDVHRDGAKGKRVTSINGKDTAQLMLFNGLSRNSKGEIAYLKNSNLQDNLAFSLQLQLMGRDMYPGLMFKNYLSAYRYNMHLRKKSMLVETGTNYNTIEEAKNSMEYLADILYEVLTGE